MQFRKEQSRGGEEKKEGGTRVTDSSPVQFSWVDSSRVVSPFEGPSTSFCFRFTLYEFPSHSPSLLPPLLFPLCFCVFSLLGAVAFCADCLTQKTKLCLMGFCYALFSPHFPLFFFLFSWHFGNNVSGFRFKVCCAAAAVPYATISAQSGPRPRLHPCPRWAPQRKKSGQLHITLSFRFDFIKQKQKVTSQKVEKSKVASFHILSLSLSLSLALLATSKDGSVQILSANFNAP